MQALALLAPSFVCHTLSLLFPRASLAFPCRCVRDAGSCTSILRQPSPCPLPPSAVHSFRYVLAVEEQRSLLVSLSLSLCLSDSRLTLGSNTAQVRETFSSSSSSSRLLVLRLPMSSSLRLSGFLLLSRRVSPVRHTLNFRLSLSPSLCIFHGTTCAALPPSRTSRPAVVCSLPAALSRSRVNELTCREKRAARLVEITFDDASHSMGVARPIRS